MAHVSTGCTLLNLILSGDPKWGIAAGEYIHLVGDSSAGKTMLALTILAEASISPEWDDYELQYDEPEFGALMDFSQFFGEKMDLRTERINPPSETVEALYADIETRLVDTEKGGHPWIRVVDSMDALTSRYAEKKFAQMMREEAGAAVGAGDFGDGKAQINSRNLRRLIPRIKAAGCVLLILSQTRDRIAETKFDHGPKSIWAGGRALKFYASSQIWLEGGRKMQATVNGRKRQTGVVARIRVTKNRISGREWSCDLPIYHSLGIDDAASMIDFLVYEKTLAADSGRLSVSSLGTKLVQGAGDGFSSMIGAVDSLETIFPGKRDTVLRRIDENHVARAALTGLVRVTWENLIAATRVKRENKYARSELWAVDGQPETGGSTQ
jgi:hypothetical protein